MGFHLAAGKAIKRMAPTASSVSIGSGSGRCGAGLIRRSWSGLFRRIRPAGPRSDAVFNAPAFVAGLDDIAVMGQAVEQRGGTRVSLIPGRGEVEVREDLGLFLRGSNVRDQFGSALNDLGDQVIEVDRMIAPGGLGQAH